ncbi:hypothetical protein A2U01_0093255, partial [Trifolium medium]|nr:hypothetical protein [Trifolium medium]
LPPQERYRPSTMGGEDPGTCPEYQENVVGGDLVLSIVTDYSLRPSPGVM